MILSARDNATWLRLMRRLGGVPIVAQHLGRSEKGVRDWSTGYRRCPPKMLEALIRLCDDHSELERLQDELRIWRDAALERREASRQKSRERFVERFGHLPDDKDWQAYKHREPLPAASPNTPESFTPVQRKRILPF